MVEKAKVRVLTTGTFNVFSTAMLEEELRTYDALIVTTFGQPRVAVVRPDNLDFSIEGKLPSDVLDLLERLSLWIDEGHDEGKADMESVRSVLELNGREVA